MSLARLNPVPGADLVAVPDVEFPPIMAGWLSALVLMADLPVARRTALLSRLVPLAATDETMLDLVFGRLLLALDDPDSTLARRVLDALDGHRTTDPAGGTEAGVS